MFETYRTNLRNKQLLKKLPFPETGKLLDVSSGDGSFLEALHNLHPKLQLFGIDLSLPEQPSSEINFQVADATKLPFEDNHFDIIVCSLSLHHYQNANLVLYEIHRVLQDNGRVYLTDIMPGNEFTQRIYNFMGCSSPYHFEKYYTEQELIALCQNHLLTFDKKFPISPLPRVIAFQFTKKNISLDNDFNSVYTLLN